MNEYPKHPGSPPIEQQAPRDPAEARTSAATDAEPRLHRNESTERNREVWAHVDRAAAKAPSAATVPDAEPVAAYVHVEPGSFRPYLWMSEDEYKRVASMRERGVRSTAAVVFTDANEIATVALLRATPTRAEVDLEEYERLKIAYDEALLAANQDDAPFGASIAYEEAELALDDFVLHFGAKGVKSDG